MTNEVLQPQELCDLLNFILGYNMIDRTKRRAERIEVFVVKTWVTGRTHNLGFYRVQRWVEFKMREEGWPDRKNPGPPSRVGRPLTIPVEVQRLCAVRDYRLSLLTAGTVSTAAQGQLTHARA